MSKKFKYPNTPIPHDALPHDNVGVNHLGLHTVDDTQRFICGTRAITWDGREYIYSKSAGACISGQGVEFTAAGYIAYTAFGVKADVGARSVIAPAASHSALAEDELAGGYVVIWDGSTNNVQFRGILGNEAAEDGAAFRVYLDAPLTEAVVAVTSDFEAYQNPYIGLQTGTMNYNPKAGVPAAKVTAANKFFWCQKRGMVFAAPQGGKLGTTEGGYCGGMWSDVGNISDVSTSLNGATVPVGRGTQYAGHAVLGDADNIGPLFMLQG